MIAIVLFSHFSISKDVATNCKLNLSATFDEDYDGYTVIMEEIDNNYEEIINFVGCKDVTIEISGEAVQLDAAIRDNILSFQQIWMLAQEDAENGFCMISWISKNGLTKFRYQYPQVDLWLTNDIYKTPDGKEYHIRNITICKPNIEFETVFSHKETGERIDHEDWGIQFTVSDVSSSEITLRYLQSSNQVIGQLYATHFEIYKRDPFSDLPCRTDNYTENLPFISDLESEYSLSWEKTYGILDSGDYTMYLYLTDTYEEEKVSPLVNNFYDTQIYAIEFTVP